MGCSDPFRHHFRPNRSKDFKMMKNDPRWKWQINRISHWRHSFICSAMPLNAKHIRRNNDWRLIWTMASHNPESHISNLKIRNKWIVLHVIIFQTHFYYLRLFIHGRHILNQLWLDTLYWMTLLLNELPICAKQLSNFLFIRNLLFICKTPL